MNQEFMLARKEYRQQALLESEIDPDPISQFQKWFAAAVAANVPEPEAANLATCTPAGRPAARIVLLKGCEQRRATKDHEECDEVIPYVLFHPGTAFCSGRGWPNSCLR